MAHQPTIDAYNKIADEYYYRNSVSIWNKEYEIFFDLLPKGGNVLEVGCGIGRDAEFLVKKYDYVGIDASEAMLNIAKKKVPSAKFLLQDFFALDFKDNTFDGFWAAAALLHVPKDEINKSLQEIKSVLKPNAIGFISLKEKRMLDEGIIWQEQLGVERFFAFYTKDEFRKILEANGFEIVEMTKEIENDKDKTVWLCYFVKAKRL